MAATQEQIQEAFNDAINLGISTEMDDTTLISRITGYEVSEEETEQNAVNRRKALDRIYINGKSITSMLGEGNNYSLADYVSAIREALSPESNSFVTVMSDNFLDQRAVLAVTRPLSNEDIDYSDPETWFETEERHNEIQNKQNKLEEAMRSKASASINYSASYNENSAGAIQKAIRATLSDNDIDLIKSVTGLDELNNENIRKALDSIYIDGKNLTDKLGMENENNIAAYAGAIRSALSFDNDSFITIMNRNSIMTDPRAVIINAPENSSPEVRAAAERKAVASLHYTVNYKEDVQRIVKDTQKELHDRKIKDVALFYADLFPGRDASKIDDLFGEIHNKFLHDNVIPNLIGSRELHDYVYAYMLTKNYPEDSDHKLTYRELLTDNSKEMDDFKRKMGSEFIKIFRKDPNKDTIKQLNEETYPTFVKMTEAVLHLKCEYHDLSEKDDLRNAVLDCSARGLAFNMNQEVEKCDMSLLGEVGMACTLDKAVSLLRLNYMASDSFLTDGIQPDGTVASEAFKAAYNQAFIDNTDMNDLKTISNATLGNLGTEANDMLCKNIADVQMVNSHDFNDALVYMNGQGGVFQDQFKNHKSLKSSIRAAAEAIEKNREHDNDDLVLRCITTGSGRFAHRSYKVELPNLLKYFSGEPQHQRPEKLHLNSCDGMNKSILNDLTGCPTIVSREFNETDKERLWAAVNAVYINNKTMAEYFGLTAENIGDKNKLREAEKGLTVKIMNTMESSCSEFVFVKNGNDSFQPVRIDILKEMIDSYKDTMRNGSPEEKEYMRQMYEKRKENMENNAKISQAYADMLSGRADSETINSFADKFKEFDLKPPVINIRLDITMEILSQSDPKNVLRDILRRPLNTPKEFEDAAKSIYIGTKSLAQLCEKHNNISDEECMRQRVQLLKDNFNALLENNGTEPQVMSVRDSSGALKSLKIVNMSRTPVEPKPVKLYSDFEKHFHFDSTVNANRQAYEAYTAEKSRYESDKALYEKCEKYNSSAEEIRLKIINEARFGPAKRTLNVSQLQMTNSSMTNTPALTQPTAQRGARENERTAQ